METIDSLQSKIDRCKARIADLRTHQMMSDGSQARRDYDQQISAENKLMAGFVDQLVKLQALHDDAPDFDLFGEDVPDFVDEPEFFDVPEFEEVPHVSNQFKGAGLYLDMPNEWYRAQEGVSKSDLVYLDESECDFLWNKNAPRDPEALKTFEIGTAFHCIIFEYEQFDNRYIIAPEFNRRTTQGKADEAAFLQEMSSEGKIIISHEDNRKIRAMRESCYAHPKARLFLEADGICEASIFHRDVETGEMTKVRPDKIIQFQDRHIIIDAKSIGQFDQMAASVEKLDYHVQDAMYSDVYQKHFGFAPEFHFLFCSTTVEIGRYSVTVRELSDDWRLAGYNKYRELLLKYHEAKTNDDWLDRVSLLQRPRWAK